MSQPRASAAAWLVTVALEFSLPANHACQSLGLGDICVSSHGSRRRILGVSFASRAAVAPLFVVGARCILTRGFVGRTHHHQAKSQYRRYASSGNK